MTSAISNTAYGVATEGQLGLVKGDTFRQFQAANGTQNYIINSLMTISQRGDFSSSTSLTNGYKIDRFEAAASGVTANIQHLSTSQPTDLPSKSFRITATSSATGAIFLGQVVENPRELRGRQVTVSAWVKSNSTNARLRVFSGSGTFGISQSAGHSGGGGWELLTVTYTISNSESDAANFTCQFCIYDAGNVSITSGDYIEVALPMLNIGTERAQFSLAGGGAIGAELALCQRYYETNLMDGESFATSTPAVGANLTEGVTNGNSIAGHAFQVAKRAIPTVTVYAPNTGTQNAMRVSGGDLSVTTGGETVYSFRIINNSGSAVPSQTSLSAFHFTADAEF